MKTNLKLILGLLLISFGTYFIITDVDYSRECFQFQGNAHETFNPALSHINTISLAIAYIDSLYHSKRNIEERFDSFLYFHTAKQVVKQKFYHGIAEVSWKENWISYVLGKMIWKDIGYNVSPDEVIQHCSALCSQQTMVFTEIMKRKGYDYRYVYIGKKEIHAGHFCCEIFFQNKWHFTDVNMEPNWSRLKGQPNKSIEEITSSNKIKFLYDSSYDDVKAIVLESPDITFSFKNALVGQNMMRFHKITAILSWMIPMFLGLFFVMKSVIKRKDV